MAKAFIQKPKNLCSVTILFADHTGIAREKSISAAIITINHFENSLENLMFVLECMGIYPSYLCLGLCFFSVLLLLSALYVLITTVCSTFSLYLLTYLLHRRCFFALSNRSNVFLLHINRFKGSHTHPRIRNQHDISLAV